jgi:hypothetical protein
MDAVSSLQLFGAGLARPVPDWCPDEDTRHSAIARRNVLAGLWAGSLMGLNGPELTAYVCAVHAADHQVPGDDDIASKLAGDLRRAGLHEQAAQVRLRLSAFHREALSQTSMTD